MPYTILEVYIKNFNYFYTYIVVSLNVCHDIGLRGAISTVRPSTSECETSSMDFHITDLK